MSTCPKCSSDLPADFGMLACPGCQSMLFIDMDGVAHLGEAVEAIPEPSPEISPETLPMQPPLDDGPMAMDAFLDPSPVELAPDSAPAEFRSPSAEDPLGLNAFANSEVSQAKSGPLVFKILISGIDSKEMREIIREAMTDARFGWDAADWMSRISKGALTIENLSPIKATVLVNRIKRLPLRIQWEQYAVTQLEGPAAEAPADDLA